MPSGGARPRAGRPQDPTAFRRERDAGDWTELPAAGRETDPPEWPLAGLDTREWELWRKLWLMPQALMWERYGQDLEVALYVRQLVRFELPRSSVILGTLVRQMADSLGLTTPGLRTNRWKIMRDGDEKPVGAPSSVPKSSSRSRLKVVDGGAA